MNRRNLLKKTGASLAAITTVSAAGCLDQNKTEGGNTGKNCDDGGEDCRIERELAYPEWLVRNREPFFVQRIGEQGEPLDVIKHIFDLIASGNRFQTMKLSFPNVRFPTDFKVQNNGVPGVGGVVAWNTPYYEVTGVENVEEPIMDASNEQVKQFLKQATELDKDDQHKYATILRRTPIHIYTVEFEFDGLDSDEETGVRYYDRDEPWQIGLSEYYYEGNLEGDQPEKRPEDEPQGYLFV